MKLSGLAEKIEFRAITGTNGGDPEVRSIHYRAQDVTPGGVFVAIAGHSADGHEFIDKALKRGAVAVIVQRPVDKPVVTVAVENTRKALSALAAAFYGEPARQLCIVGITGTNGKTTTAYLVESIFRKAGFQVGVIGTINFRYGGRTFPNPITTPESLDLQRILSDMRAAGVSHVVMEVSSHAIDLFRVADCWPDVGVFTNLSQDHLDFHGDMETYWQCKQRLFLELLPKKKNAAAVVNCTDRRGAELFEKLTVSALSYGTGAEHAIRSVSVTQDLTGCRGEIRTPAGTFSLKTPLVGLHNVENILGAAGVGVAMGLPIATIQAGIEDISGIPGRLERIPDRSGRFVFVDYAHTPDALEHVLTALRSLARGHIICVFGCGGDRDRKKRPQMGEIAGRLADLTVVTSDNPRTEPPEAIIDEILPGVARSAPRRYRPADIRTDLPERGHVVVPERREAIQIGIRAARPGDTVLIAGKGHETYQILGRRTLPFDDRKEAVQALGDMENHRTGDPSFAP